MTITGRIVYQIILMVILGIIEVLKRLEFSEESFVPLFFIFKSFPGIFKQFRIQIRRVIDAGPVLVTYIMPLSAILSYIDDKEESLKESLNRDDSRIETDAYRFPESGISLFYLRISRVWNTAVGISRCCVEYTVELSESVFHAPETASGKIQCASAVHYHFLVM